jgi:predicted CopG family antitoxin
MEHDMTGNEDVPETTELVPVTEERLQELRELKAENQSYDELLGLLVQEHKRRRLTESIGRGPKDEDEPRVWIHE